MCVEKVLAEMVALPRNNGVAVDQGQQQSGDFGGISRGNGYIRKGANGVGFEPNERTCSIVMRACAKAGQLEAAFAVLEIMQASRGGGGEKGGGPLACSAANAVHFTTLIHACGKAGRLDRAFQTLQVRIQCFC